MFSVVGDASDRITDSGRIIYRGGYNNRSPDPATEISVSGVVMGDMSGRIPSEVIRAGIDALGTSISIINFSANNGGQAAATVSISDQVGGYQKLVAPGGTDTRSGPFLSFNDALRRGVALNDLGEVVFVAQFKDPGGKTQSGLFKGPDLVKDRVIATGDTLFDSTVVGLLFDGGVGFNNAGQVAFRASLQDGTTAIVRADPVVVGTNVEWVNGGGGTFDVVANWKPVNGDPPRVPQATGNVDDTILFDLPQAYGVDVGSQHAARLIVRNGSVILNNGDLKVDGLSFNAPSTVVDNARLILGSGSSISVALTNNHALIGESAAARVDVGRGGDCRWVCLGSLSVGGVGEGIMRVSSGLVESAESRVGNGAGGGFVGIGLGGVWRAGNLAVGMEGKGELMVEQGGYLESDDAFIGKGASLGNKITIQGGNGANKASRWYSDRVFVGEQGSGRLEVEDGGHAELVGVVIGGTPRATGSVRITGANATTGASKLEVANLDVGSGGVGELIIEDGGFVNLTSGVQGEMNIGDQGGYGTVIVSGINLTTGQPSRLTVSGGVDSLDFGSGFGTMLIKDGGQVISTHALVTSGIAGRPSEVQVIGGASVWNGRAELLMGFDHDPAESFVTLIGGTVDFDEIGVGGRGTIRGFGTLRCRHLLHNGGTISPGLSPGRLELDGNYEQALGGRLKIEVGGPVPGVSHDQFVVNGNATFGGTLELRFIDGFAPKQGDSFQFLVVGGDVNGGFTTVEVRNLASEFRYDIVTNGTVISLIALNDGVFVPPLQGRVGFSNVVTVGGVSYLSYGLNSANPCTILEPKGSISRHGQDFYLTLEERDDPNCLGHAENAPQQVPLGALQAGSYVVRFMSDGVEILNHAFVISDGTGQVLDVARTAGRELHLQINGVPNARYTMQQSTDLNAWFDLPTHIGPFLGPYDIYEPLLGAPAMYYRVRIE